MLLALPQPAVLATSVASYLVAPAAGRRVTAWLEYPAAHATSPDAVTRRRADRLVIADRAGRRTQVVYDGGCAAAQVCDSVATPQAGADTVVYAVADGRHADLAAATLQRRPSRLVAQMTSPAGGGPPPFALAGPAAVWYTAGAIRQRPPNLKEAASTLVGAPAGGTVRAVVRHEPVTAWIARSRAGQDTVYEQLDGGRPSLLYRESRAGVRLTALAPLDGGRVALVALRSAGGSRTASVLLLTPGVIRPTLLAVSAPSPAGQTYNPVLSSFGQSVAFRRRVGSERGLTDQIVVIDVLRGRTRIVASARLATTRLSDPSLGYGRVIWSSARIAGGRLVRSSVLATRA
ncbi:MAG: hypothetical protein QOH00_3424 [Gaiellales bacterium]|nr:hypothetical protein [Gaiellales bacterium]